MKTVLKMALAAVVLTGAHSVAAQLPAPAGQPLSLETALAATLADNPALRVAAYEEEAARDERRAAFGLRLPQINLTGAYAYLGKDIGFDFNDMKAPVSDAAGRILGSGLITDPRILGTIQGLLEPLMGADWGLTLQERSLGFVGGEVTLPLWMGGKINAANRAARINETLAASAGDQTRNSLISQLVERYFGLALARQAVAVRRQVADGVRRHLADARALEASGMIARSELLYVEFKMAEAERELKNAELEAQTVAAALNNTLGGHYADAEPVTAMFVLDAVEPLASYQEQAERHNPLLEQVGLKRRLAEEGLRVQRAAFMPQVVAMGGGSLYNYQVSGLVPRWAVGVGVRFKLFDGLNREYKYSAARNTVRRVEELESKAGQDIAVLIEQLYNRMLNCRNRMTSLDASLDFADEYLKMKDAAFREGMASASDLIDAELNLAAIRIERLQTAYDFDKSLAQLLEAAGMSAQFAACARRADARAVYFDKK